MAMGAMSGAMGRSGHFKMGVGSPNINVDSGMGKQRLDKSTGKGSSDATKNTQYSSTGSRQFGAANAGGGGGGISPAAFMGMGFLGYKTK
jgi:hypothetical protein